MIFDMPVTIFLIAVMFIQLVYGTSFDAQAEREKSRKLIYDTGNNRNCFDTNYNRGYADYLLDPFKANGNRGDWGKFAIDSLFSSSKRQFYRKMYTRIIIWGDVVIVSKVKQ